MSSQTSVICPLRPGTKSWIVSSHSAASVPGSSAAGHEKCVPVRSAAAVNTPRSAYSPKCAHLRRMWSVMCGRSRCTTVSSAPLSAPLCVAGMHEWPQMTNSHTAAQTVRMRLARQFIFPPLPSARGSCPPSTCGTWRHSCHCRRGGSARPR